MRFREYSRGYFGLAVALAVGLIGAFAGPPLTITDSGYYVTLLDSAGNPTLERVETVVDLRSGSDKPEPPKDPPALDPPPNGISANVAKWSVEVGLFIDAQRYALVMETARDGVADGLIDYRSVFPVLRKSADRLLSDEWSEFRRRLSDYLAEAVQEGDFSTEAKTRNQLELIRYGLEYSAHGKAESLTPQQAITVVSTVNEIIAEGDQ